MSAGDPMTDQPVPAAPAYPTSDEYRRGWDAGYAAAPAPTAPAGLREFRFTTWDDTPLVITVDDEDPGDMGEPRNLIDYDDGPTTYVSVRAAVASPSEEPGPCPDDVLNGTYDRGFDDGQHAASPSEEPGLDVETWNAAIQRAIETIGGLPSDGSPLHINRSAALNALLGDARLAKEPGS